jgi:formate/nitrite transporter FocA (FNT family)
VQWATLSEYLSKEDSNGTLWYGCLCSSSDGVRVYKAGIVKSKRDFFSTFTVSVMAGVFIGLGAAFFTFVIHDSMLSVGLTKIIRGFVVRLSEILVIIIGLMEI